MAVDTLHTLVSSAIWRAEQLDELDIDSPSAWFEVSKLEEELANVLPVSEAEGRIARRGAIRAALKAGDHVRAQDLVQRFAAEEGVPRRLCAELRKMLNADTQELAEQFPFAAKHHTPRDIRKLAYHLQQNGPFALVA